KILISERNGSAILFTPSRVTETKSHQSESPENLECLGVKRPPNSIWKDVNCDSKVEAARILIATAAHCKQNFCGFWALVFASRARQLDTQWLRRKINPDHPPQAHYKF